MSRATRLLNYYRNRFFDPSTLQLPQHLRLAYPSQRRQNEPIEHKSSYEYSPRPSSTRNQPSQLRKSQDPEKERQTVRGLEDETAEPNTEKASGQIGLKTGAGNAQTQKDQRGLARNDAQAKARPPAVTGRQDSPLGGTRGSNDGSEHSERERDEQNAGLTPPNSGRFLQGSRTEPETAGNQSSLFLRGKEQSDTNTTSQDVSKQSADAFSPRSKGQVNGASNNSPSNNTADLPSRFIQDTLDEDNTIMDIPPLHDESGRSQHGTSSIDQSPLEQRPPSALRNATISGLNGDSTQDPTFSRRPPMRIDTAAASQTKDIAVIAGKAGFTVPEAATQTNLLLLQALPNLPLRGQLLGCHRALFNIDRCQRSLGRLHGLCLLPGGSAMKVRDLIRPTYSPQSPRLLPPQRTCRRSGLGLVR